MSGEDAIKEAETLHKMYERDTKRLFKVNIAVLVLLTIGNMALAALSLYSSEQAREQAAVNTELIQKLAASEEDRLSASEEVRRLAALQSDSLEQHRQRSEVNFDQILAGIRCLARTHYRSYRAFERCVANIKFETSPRPPNANTRPNPSPRPTPPAGKKEEPTPAPQPSPPPPTCNPFPVIGVCRP